MTSVSKDQRSTPQAQ